MTYDHRSHPLRMGGPAIPDGIGIDDDDTANPAVDAFFHAIFHAEEFCEEGEYEAASAWALVAQAYATMA